MLKRFYTRLYELSMQIAMWSSNKAFNLRTKELETEKGRNISDFVKAMQRQAKIIGSRPKRKE